MVRNRNRFAHVESSCPNPALALEQFVVAKEYVTLPQYQTFSFYGYLSYRVGTFLL